MTLDVLFSIYFQPGWGINLFFWILTWVVMFAVPLGHEYFQYRRRKAAITQLSQVLAGTDPINHKQQLFDFALRIEKLSTIRPAWDMFYSSLITHDDIVWARHEFGEYFTYESLHPQWKWLTPRVISNLPGWLTAIGILGTFIGLVMGLDKLDVQNSERLQKGIGELVGGINTAYLTSIWGVTASILFLGIERYLADRTRSTMEAVSTLMDQRFRLLTPEVVLLQVLREQQQHTLTLKQFNSDLSGALREALREQQQHTRTLESFGSSLPGTLRAALDESVGRHLAPPMDRMAALVEDVANRSTQAQEKALDQIVQSFVDRMDSLLGARFEQLAEALNDAAGTLNAFTVETRGLFAEITKHTDSQRQLQGDLAYTFERLQGTLGEINGTVLRLRDFATAWTELQTQLDRQHSRSQELIVELSQAIGTTQEAAAAIARDLTQVIHQSRDTTTEAARQAAQVVEQIHSTTTTIARELSQVVEETQGATARAAEGIAAGAGRIEGSVARLETGWQSHADRFERVHHTLNETAVEFAGRVRGDIEQYLTTLDEQLARAVASLSTVLGDLEGTVDSLQEMLDRTAQLASRKTAPATKAAPEKEA